MSKINLNIDFDGVIATEPGSEFPLCGLLRKDAKEYIDKLFQDEAFIITIFTARTGHAEWACKQFLKDHNIPFHYFNEHSKESIEKYGDGGRKLGGVYIDNQTLENYVNGIENMKPWSEIYELCMKLRPNTKKEIIEL